MPVFRTPDGRIVEEKTGVSPPEDGGANDGRAADGGVSVRDERTAKRTGGGAAPAGGRRGTGYADPTVVRRPSAATDEQKTAGRAARSGDERTRLAGAIPGGTPGAHRAGRPGPDGGQPAGPAATGPAATGVRETIAKFQTGPSA